MNRATPILETPRLILQPLELADAPAVQRIFPQWEIVRYLNDKVPWPYPPDGALTFLRDVALPAVAAGEAWHWSIRPKTDPMRLIGCINLSLGEEDNRGFWLDPAWQGQGLMSEAAIAVTDFWFGPLGQKRLRIPKAIKNEPSRRLSLSSGMRVVAVDERAYVGGHLPTETWELTREEWLARRS
jgi:ribosomal-protein-alanine N-acetyltransferase